MTTTPPPTSTHDDAHWNPSGPTVMALAAVTSFFLTMWLGLAMVMGTQGDSTDGAEAQVVADASVDGGLLVVATEFAFAPATISVPAGPFTLEMTNEGLAFHNLEVEGLSGFVLEAEPGERDAGELDLAPGTYRLFCSVPGHAAAGMEGTLDVGG